MKKTRIKDVLRLNRRPVEIEPTNEYVAIGVRSFGKGVFHYPPAKGSELSKLRFFQIRPHELVVSNIKAWEGAIAVSSPDDAGCIGSNRFLSYAPIDDAVDVRYMRYFLLSEAGLPLIQRASPGSADRNRTLAIERFENLVIPLPDLFEQRRIVSRLTTLLGYTDVIEQRLKRNDGSLIVALYPRLVTRRLAAETTTSQPVGELVEFVNDLVRPGEPTEAAEAFVGLQHIESHTGRRIGSLPLGGEKGRKFRFQPGDVVYGYLRPYLNKVWVADMHGLCSVDQYVLRPKNGVPASYLAHALRSRATLDQAIELTHSLQLPRLRSGLLADLEIPVVGEERLGAVTDDLDRALETIVEARGLRLRQNTVLKGLKESILNRAFGGPL